MGATAVAAVEDRTIPPEGMDNSWDHSGSTHYLKGAITIRFIMLVSFQIYFLKKETIYKHADGCISMVFLFHKANLK